MFDIVIQNGYVVDGTGNPWYKADIGIKSGKIAEICRSISPADITIDAKGMIVSPGFIDMHTHSDYTLLVDPKADSFVRQGVTTELIGLCGYSMAPISDKNKEHLSSFWDVPEGEISWQTFSEYLNKFQDQGVTQNIVPLVGHNAIRSAVMGLEDRKASGPEMQEMKDLVEQAMNDGAFGLSSGLSYVPSCYADTHELTELCKVVEQFGGIYVTHARCGRPRSYWHSPLSPPYPMYGVGEAIKIGLESGVKVQISHLMSFFPMEHKSDKVLGMIDKARLAGIDVTFDQIPYVWCPGNLTPSSFPAWSLEGGLLKLKERLNDPETREKIKAEIKPEASSWEETMIAYCESNPEVIGKNIAEIAEMRKTDPKSVIIDVVSKELNGYNIDVRVLVKISLEEDLLRVFTHPTAMIGSDGIAVAPNGLMAKKGLSNPANYGAFPRVYRRYVREGKILRLEEAVRKMTSLPAQRLGLSDRGLIRPGLWADLVVFDPSTISDKDIFEDESVHPKGIKFLIINGQLVIEEGRHTGLLPGRMLRSNDEFAKEVKTG